jgi:glutathionyl-hydroquinone reductase
MVVETLSNRTSTMMSAYLEEIQNYKTGLAEGKYWDTLDKNWAWLHNKINDRMYKNGVGISQLQEAAHKIRLAIQSHLENFDPLKK